eukprot:361313-Chlamydomonas_euryale.AAC.16
MCYRVSCSCIDAVKNRARRPHAASFLKKPHVGRRGSTRTVKSKPLILVSSQMSLLDLLFTPHLDLWHMCAVRADACRGYALRTPLDAFVAAIGCSLL